MLHGVSLDQLSTFIAVADKGSFSGAGRRLRRARSVVSQTLAKYRGRKERAESVPGSGRSASYSRSPWEIKFRCISRTAFRVATNPRRPEVRRRS
jgi:hypothetical protein